MSIALIKWAPVGQGLHWVPFEMAFPSVFFSITELSDGIEINSGLSFLLRLVDSLVSPATNRLLASAVS